MTTKEKRKTHTSTAVKQQYIDKTYTQFQAKLRNDTYEEINDFIQSKSWSKADFIKIAYEKLKDES